MRIFTTSVVVALAVLTARPSSAQSQRPPQDPSRPQGGQQTRPYRGVFGGGVSNTEQLLTLGLNFGGGFDSSVLVDNSPTAAPSTSFSRRRSSFGQGSASLNYSLNRAGVGISAGAGTAASYYPVLDDPIVAQHFGNVGASVSLGTKASLFAGYSVAFRPVQHLAALPGVVDPSLGPVNPFDNTLGGRSEIYRNEAADVSVNYQLARRVGVSGGYGYWRVRSPNRDRDFSNEQVSARTSFRILRDVSVYVGYRLGWNAFDPALNLPQYKAHNVDFGLYFNKALSLTRKSTLSFGTGTVGVTDHGRTSYSLTGNVHFGYELGRTWFTSLGYSRDAQFVQTFRQPVFSDSLSAHISGLISRRMRFDAGTGLASGRVGVSGTQNGYKALFASAGVGMAMTRNINTGLRYSFTRYEFDSNVQIPNDLLFQTNRHGVNVYMSTWLPLFFAHEETLMLPGKTYTVDEVLRIGRKRIWFLLLPLAIVSAATALVVRRIPDSYRSETSILVVPQRIPESYVRSTVTMRVEDRLQAIRQQILSRTLLEQTIKTFNLYGKERKGGALMADVVDRMRNEIAINVIRNGDGFTISYVGSDPRTVMRVTEDLTNSFINQSYKDRTSQAEGTNQFLQGSLDDAKRRLLDHEQKLQAYNLRHSGELPTQQTANLQAASNTQMQIQSVLNQMATNQARSRQIQKELQNLQLVAELFPPDPTPTPTSPSAPGTGSASYRLAMAKAKLANYEALKYTDAHYDVRTVKREIAALEKQVEQEALQQPMPKNTPRAITPQQFAQQQKIDDLKDELKEVTQLIAANQAEEKRLRELASGYQFRADMAPTRASELVELTRDYATLNGIYSSLLAKQEESKLAANLESRQIGEQFRILDPARLPEKPFKPNRPMYNLMGLGGGLAIGVMLVGLLEYRDSSFKTDEEISTLLTLPVLAVVPLMQSDEDRQRASKRRLVMSVGFGSTVLGCLAVLVYTFVR